MSTQHNTPVVIVGAGPTAVMLAIELARRGVEVRVLDKQPSPPQESRAIGIHARTLEIFHQLGLIEEFLELGHRVDGFVIHTGAWRDIEGRFVSLETPYPFLLTLSQEHTQRILNRRLESLGVTIERGVDVTDLHEDTDRVELRMHHRGDPREGTLAAGWVVGCDGAHSIVRKRLGLAFDGEDYAQDFLMAEVTIDPPLRRDRFHVFAHTRGPLPMFPLPSDRWRIFLPQVPNRAGERAAPTMQEIERLAARRGPAGMKLTDPSLLAAFRCYRRSTKTMRTGRVLLAGDAAHIHSPAGGQGMNTGLHDAFNLGWKLALVTQAQAPSTILDSYQAERMPIATGVLALSHALVKTFATTSPRKRWLRDRVLPTLMGIPTLERRYMTRLAQLSHNYRRSPLATGTPRTTHPRSIAPGDRLPSVPGLLRDNKPISTLDLIGSRKHTLLVLTGTPANPGAANKAIARLARWRSTVQTTIITPQSEPRHLHTVTDPHHAAHRRYHAHHGRLLLVRPDGHLACAAPLARADTIAQYLQDQTSTAPDHHNISAPSAPVRTIRTSTRASDRTPATERP